MRLDVVSLTPEAFAPLQGLGVIGRACTAAIGLVVHLAVAIRGEIPRVVNVKFSAAGCKRAANDPKTLQWRKGLRGQACLLYTSDAADE